MTVAVPAGTTAGTYTVNAIATSGSNSGSASASLSVLSAPTLAIGVSAGPLTLAAYTAGSTVPVAAHVTFGSAPASAAAVVFTITDPTGRSSSRKTTTDSNGAANWPYKIGARDPKGTYRVTASATYGSSSAAVLTPATFTVN
jgi:hypothetical protein